MCMCAVSEGHRHKHISTALEAATARRDELQQLLAQDKERFIEEQAVLAQQADVTYSSSPAANEVSSQHDTHGKC